jgi:ketosteroid isomerase-like protein
MTLEEAADRVAIRELIDAYAHCADRRDADGQMALFTADTHFVVYMDARSGEPSMELHSRAELAPVFGDLNRYVATTHFNGQSTIELAGDTATGETYCLAHHVFVDEDSQMIFIASIRYHDTFSKSDSSWLFSERKLYVDWNETRPLRAPAG